MKRKTLFGLEQLEPYGSFNFIAKNWRNAKRQAIEFILREKLEESDFCLFKISREKHEKTLTINISKNQPPKFRWSKHNGNPY